MNNSRFIKWIGLVLGPLLLAFVFGRVVAPGYDLYQLFYPAIRDVWQGEFTYARWPLFTNPPWALLMLLPLGLFSIQVAHGLLVVITLLVLAWVMRDYRRFVTSYTLAAISAPMFALLWVGQIEVVSLLGVIIGYRAVIRHKPWQLSLALLLLMIKPQETWVIVLLLLIGTVRRWAFTDWAQIILPALIVAIGSSIWLGGEWISRILNRPTYVDQWQNFSLWQLIELVPGPIVIGSWLILAGLASWAMLRAGLSRLGIGLAAVASNLLSPYLTGPHLLVSMALGWGALFDRSTKWGSIVYLTSLTPLLRLSSGNQDLNRLDLIFALAVFAGLLVVVISRQDE